MLILVLLCRNYMLHESNYPFNLFKVIFIVNDNNSKYMNIKHEMGCRSKNMQIHLKIRPHFCTVLCQGKLPNIKKYFAFVTFSDYISIRK